MCAESLQQCLTLCDSVHCGLPGSLSRRGFLQTRILESIGQYCLPYPSRAPPTPLSIWCCQNPCDPSSCNPLQLALTGTSPSPPEQPQEQTPVDDSHAEVEIKPQMKPGGSVAKEEDPKYYHQIYKLQIKST